MCGRIRIKEVIVLIYLMLAIGVLLLLFGTTAMVFDKRLLKIERYFHYGLTDLNMWIDTIDQMSLPLEMKDAINQDIAIFKKSRRIREKIYSVNRINSLTRNTRKLESLKSDTESTLLGKKELIEKDLSEFTLQFNAIVAEYDTKLIDKATGMLARVIGFREIPQLDIPEKLFEIRGEEL